MIQNNPLYIIPGLTAAEIGWFSSSHFKTAFWLAASWKTGHHLSDIIQIQECLEQLSFNMKDTTQEQEIHDRKWAEAG